MKLFKSEIAGTDCIELRSEDGGITAIGPVAQMMDEEEAQVLGLDPTRWCVVDMVDIYEVENLEEALASIDAEVIGL